MARERGRCAVDDFEVIRITNENDGTILPRNYAYWQNINAHANMPFALVFVGTDRGPCLFQINKQTMNVTTLGNMFPQGYALQNSTAEGWYWSPYDPFLIYCTDDKHLYRYNVNSKSLQTVFTWHNESQAVRQFHSSFTGNVHSASVLQMVSDGAWPKVESIVYYESAVDGLKRFPAQGVLDECQIDKSGRWLLIKEGDDHRVVDLLNETERFLSDQAGAVGHSDNGFYYAVGADNWQTNAAWRLHDFALGVSTTIYETSWEEQVLHVSHCNALLKPPETQWVLGSGTCPYLMKIYLDGSKVAEKVAPSMTVGTDYDFLPKANIDPYGELAFWIAFDGHRHDAFVVKVP